MIWAFWQDGRTLCARDSFNIGPLNKIIILETNKMRLAKKVYWDGTEFSGLICRVFNPEVGGIMYLWNVVQPEEWLPQEPTRSEVDFPL